MSPNPPNPEEDLKLAINKLTRELMAGSQRDLDMFGNAMAQRLTRAISARDQELLDSIATGTQLLVAKHGLQVRSSSVSLLSNIFEAIVKAALAALGVPALPPSVPPPLPPHDDV
jgi:hypothetical protein